MLKILLADDHEIIRRGLITLIRGFALDAIIDEAPDGNVAFEKISRNDFDLIVLDINMPGTPSLELIKNIMATKPVSRILVFSNQDEKVYAKTYLQAGVMGYIMKSAPEKEIRKGIENIIGNRRYISAKVIQALAGDTYQYKPGDHLFSSLSERESEIVQHMIKGETVAEISRALNIRPSTICTYKSRVFEKLNVGNIIELNLLLRLNNGLS